MGAEVSSPRRSLNWRLLFFAIVAVVVIVDRITKQLVNSNLAHGERIEIIGEWFQLRHVHNRGIAFGMFSELGSVLILLTIVVAVVLVFLLSKIAMQSMISLIGSALLVGGALGNLFDRTYYKYVIDFLDFPRFPTFNVADIAITTGVLTLVVALWFEREEQS